MLTAKKNVYLTAQGKATFDSDEGKNELLAKRDSQIDDHTVEELELEKMFADDAKKSAEAAEKAGTLLEQAKARQKAQAEADKEDKTASAKTAPKTQPVNPEGGNK